MRIDWRGDDPAGLGFRPSMPNAVMAGFAIAVQNGLSLSFSVQDWLEVDEEPFFLEVNPQGQWLFLAEANDRVGSALALHLRYAGKR